MVVIAACGGSKPQPEPLTANPPASVDSGMTSEQCKAIVADTACNPESATCSIEGDGCGLVGYVCRAGTWQPSQVACNPPPPE